MNVNAEMTKLDRESLVGSGEQTSIETDVGLRGMAAVLPIHTRDLEELQRSKLLVSDRSALEELGFEKVHVCDATHDINWLALESARRAMGEAEVERGEIDVLIWASALSETHVRNQTAARPTPSEELLSGFNYRASWLQEELHLDNARVMGVAQQGCAGMFSALSTAHALLVSDSSLRNVLCVGVDALPEGAPREILYSLISDAGCAVVLSRENLQCRWRSFHQVSKGYYWNIVEKQKEIIASYFPTSRAVIRELFDKASIGAADVRWVLPTGVSKSSWDILANIASLDASRIYRAPSNFGHTITADNILHLESLLASRMALPGDQMLLFTYGFGSTWCGLILEKV
jgi:3-oxoacyl-[acyl-carrier-protein] synthase III